ARANLEQQLTKIWEELLGVSPVSRSADFFELGGHSLLATRLLARIEKVFGKKVPLATLFESPMIQHLAPVLLGEDTSAPVRGVIPIHGKGSRTPIFCLHGVPSMRLLAQQLGPDQPFLLINVPEEAGVKPPYSVEQLAQLHVETIRKVQPQGPYFLLGW